MVLVLVSDNRLQELLAQVHATDIGAFVRLQHEGYSADGFLAGRALSVD